MTSEAKGRVLGVGGVFFRSSDPGRLAGWYREVLGLEIENWGATHGTSFSPEAMPAKRFHGMERIRRGYGVFWRPATVVHDQPGGG